MRHEKAANEFCPVLFKLIPPCYLTSYYNILNVPTEFMTSQHRQWKFIMPYYLKIKLYDLRYHLINFQL